MVRPYTGFRSKLNIYDICPLPTKCVLYSSRWRRDALCRVWWRLLTASRSSVTSHYRIRPTLGELWVNYMVSIQSSTQKCKWLFSTTRWNIFLDGFVETGRQLQAGGYSDEIVKQHLKSGCSSCLVVPLIVASLDPISQGRGTLRSTSLRDYIELNIRGKLSHLSEGRYLYEFSEIKSSFEGMYGRLLLTHYLLHLWILNPIINLWCTPLSKRSCKRREGPSEAVCHAYAPGSELGFVCQGSWGLCYKGQNHHPTINDCVIIQCKRFWWGGRWDRDKGFSSDHQVRCLILIFLK